MAKCKCKNTARIVSDVVQNLCQSDTCMCGNGNCGCLDVCVNPVIGTPNTLSLFAPVIYDEVGINLCTTVDLGTTIATDYPTAAKAAVRVVTIAFTYGDENVSVAPIAARPNCYLIRLSNLTVSFAVDLYDSSCRLLTTLYPTAVYLPSDTTAATYDEDTNPSVVELELFAPYGTAYAVGTTATTRVINVIGFSQTNDFVTQGINMYAIPKLINLDTVDSTATIGLTLILQSLYFSGYCVETCGRINVPKGILSTSDDSDCMQFVQGDLLDLEIRPLNLRSYNCGVTGVSDCTQSSVNTGMDCDC